MHWWYYKTRLHAHIFSQTETSLTLKAGKAKVAVKAGADHVSHRLYLLHAVELYTAYHFAEEK
jgi:hypothetical protein